MSQYAQAIDFSKNLCRIVDEPNDNTLLQKVIRGPLAGRYILTDRFNKPIIDTVFYDKNEALDFLLEHEKDEIIKD